MVLSVSQIPLPVANAMQQDMTAFVARNSTETIGMIKTQADGPLTQWVMSVAEEYLSIPAAVYELPG